MYVYNNAYFVWYLTSRYEHKMHENVKCNSDQAAEESEKRTKERQRD